MDETSQHSGELFEGGLFCAESVLLAVAQRQGSDVGWIPQVATGLCAGIARRGELCGAVAGGILGLGLVFGRCRADESADPCFMVAQILVQRFEERYGTTRCRELTHLDLATEEGRRAFRESGQRDECRRMTEQVTCWVVELIEQHG